MTKIGLIGAGQWSSPYALSAKAAGAEIVGIYTPDTSAANLAQRIGSEPATDPRNLIESCDCVLIGSPTDSHADYLVMAGEVGKPVLCASPIAADSSLLDKLKASSVSDQMYASFPLRATPEFQKLKSALTSGDLGATGILRLGMCRPMPEGWRAEDSRSGGMMLESGVHLLDALEWLAGPIERIYGASSNTKEHPYNLLVARMADGSIAHLELSWTEPDGVSYDYYEVAGSDGLLEYDSRTAPLLVVEYHEDHPREVMSPGASVAQMELQGLLRQLESGSGGFTSLDHGIGVCQKALQVKAAIDAGEVLTF